MGSRVTQTSLYPCCQNRAVHRHHGAPLFRRLPSSSACVFSDRLQISLTQTSPCDTEGDEWINGRLSRGQPVSHWPPCQAQSSHWLWKRMGGGGEGRGGGVILIMPASETLILISGSWGEIKKGTVSLRAITETCPPPPPRASGHSPTSVRV